MTTPTVVEVDCSTGVSIERPMTAEEVADLQERQAAFEAQQAAEEAAAAAKATAKASAEAKLAALGLTPEEISALG
jgi:hypothetical protein